MCLGSTVSCALNDGDNRPAVGLRDNEGLECGSSVENGPVRQHSTLEGIGKDTTVVNAKSQPTDSFDSTGIYRVARRSDCVSTRW